MSTPATDQDGIRQTIRALRAAGYRLDFVYDSQDNVPVKTEAEAIEAIMAVDEARLYVDSPDGSSSHMVYFVLGNDPEEVIADYGMTLDPILDPLMRSWWS